MKMVYRESTNKEQLILLTPTLLHHLQNKIKWALGYLRKKISLIEVELKDINGPFESGKDKECILAAYIPSLSKTIKVRHLDHNLHSTIEKASLKMAKKMGDSISRHYSKTKVSHFQNYWSKASSLRF
ncbi:MAG: hypothetical protein JNK65_07650 [Deltaproteobacteria bacterium]|nr:hypothetical protein [Deltaproteobacteria bacterium]